MDDIHTLICYHAKACKFVFNNVIMSSNDFLQDYIVFIGCIMLSHWQAHHSFDSFSFHFKNWFEGHAIRAWRSQILQEQLVNTNYQLRKVSIKILTWLIWFRSDINVSLDILIDRRMIEFMARLTFWKRYCVQFCQSWQFNLFHYISSRGLSYV